MTIWNLGSINIDHVYAVPHIPAPGETLMSTALSSGLGGKGANMSVAIARAAGHAAHIGAVGSDAVWAVERLMEYGVDTRHIQTVPHPTGHAIIAVAADGENSIVLLAGANREIALGAVEQALDGAGPGDMFLCQNETNLQIEAMRMAKAKGMTLAYAAAPFDVEMVETLAPDLDILFVNEIEAEQLVAATNRDIHDQGIAHVLVTRGAKETHLYSAGNVTPQSFQPLKVNAVDTTGAGDTFTGYVLAGLDRGLPLEQAIGQAMIAGALMVTRHGAADVIPDLADVQTVMQSG